MSIANRVFRGILVATDFSHSTEKLLQHGYWLGETTQAIVTVGRRGLPGFILGSTAEKTLHHCDCRLFTVKSADFVSPVPEPFWELHAAENVASPEGRTSVSV